MIEKREIEVAKEFDDVLVLFVELMDTIKNKKDYTALIPKLMTAIDNFTDIDDEYRASRIAFLRTASIRLVDIVDVFLPEQKVEEVAAA